MAARSKASIRKLERVTDSKKDKKFYENAIGSAVRDFYFSEFGADGAEAISKCSQNSFLAACEYARRSCINRDDLLTVKAHRLNGNGSETIAYNEEYDAEVVEILCNVYCSLSIFYDKVPSVYGFAILTGIERGTLIKWADEVTTSSRENSKKRSINDIRAARLQSLSNLAITGGKASLGSIAHLNHELWSGVPAEKPQTAVVQAWQLPDLSGKTEAIEVHGEPLPVLRPSVEDAAGLPVLGKSL